MWKNYLKIAFRNLKRNRGYAAINVAGLAVGVATFLVIALYVQHELSYDRFFPNSDRMYRIVQMNDTRSEGTAATPRGLGAAIQDRFPEIEMATVVSRGQTVALKRAEERFSVSNVFRTDSAFFEVFPYDFARGNPETALAGPDKIVITASLAERLFGDENPLGQTLTGLDGSNYQITGVVEDPPANAHFRFNALLSSERVGASVQWNSYGDFIYLSLREGGDPKQLEEKIRAFEAANEPEYMRDNNLVLQPVTHIHLYATGISNDIAPQSDVQYLYLFGAIGVLILLIACVNYMNLATARSAQRTREVGVRKVVGATRSQLIGQFLGEATVLGLFALPLALGLLRLVLPLAEQIAGQEIALYYGRGGGALLALAGIVVLTGVISGSYPALYLSRFEPKAVFTSIAGQGRRGSWLRSGLVVFQFAASVALIVSTLVVLYQLNYVQHKNLGFNEEHVVTFRDNGLDEEQYAAFKQELQSKANVLSVTSGPPPGIRHRSFSMGLPDPETEERWEIDVLDVDYDYMETLEMQLLAGRFFSREYPADPERAVILSEAAAKQLNAGPDSIGKQIEFAGEERAVIGVVRDFHNASLREVIRPKAFLLRPGLQYTVIARLVPGTGGEGLDQLRQTWEQFVPDRPVDFTFLDARIDRMYQAERRLALLFGIFAGVAISLSCLGLFGIAAYAAERRTKEIGIRKVFGASTRSIVALLSKDFAWLVLTAFLIAAPVAYYAMSLWLEDFAYRIELGPWLFVGAGLLALVIAMATVSYQAVRAALTNPADTLRYE